MMTWLGMLRSWMAWLYRLAVRDRAPRREPSLGLKLGQRGERYAAQFLQQLGYRILPQDAVLAPGEIDLIALDHQTLVFVEVKTRMSWHSGSPLEAVDRRKQRRLTAAALGFLKRHRLLEQSVRFDVIGLTWPPDQKHPVVQHVRNAFEAEGYDGLF